MKLLDPLRTRIIRQSSAFICRICSCPPVPSVAGVGVNARRAERAIRRKHIRPLSPFLAMAPWHDEFFVPTCSVHTCSTSPISKRSKDSSERRLYQELLSCAKAPQGDDDGITVAIDKAFALHLLSHKKELAQRANALGLMYANPNGCFAIKEVVLESLDDDDDSSCTEPSTYTDEELAEFVTIDELHEGTPSESSWSIVPSEADMDFCDDL